MSTKVDGRTLVTIEVSFVLKDDWDESTLRGHEKAAQEIAETLRESVKNDFGIEAWGGYDGPRAINVRSKVKKLEGPARVR